MESKFKAGAAKSKIIHPNSIPLAGYIKRTENSRGINDSIFVKTVIVDDGISRLVIISLDILKVDRILVLAIRERILATTGFKSGEIMVTATHTHSAPRVTKKNGEICNDVVFKAIIDAVEDCCKKAIVTMMPAKLGFASTKLFGVATNRNDKEGIF